MGGEHPRLGLVVRDASVDATDVPTLVRVRGTADTWEFWFPFYGGHGDDPPEGWPTETRPIPWYHPDRWLHRETEWVVPIPGWATLEPQPVDLIVDSSSVSGALESEPGAL